MKTGYANPELFNASIHSEHSAKSIWLGGAISGIVSGIAMAMVGMVTTYFLGMGLWLPVKLIAATVLGENALTSSASAILLGMAIHIMMSAILGVIFAFLTVKIKKMQVIMLWGVAFGIAVWAVMTYLVLPIVDPVMKIHLTQIPTSWFINHVFFGMTLAATPYFERVWERKSDSVSR